MLFYHFEVEGGMRCFVLGSFVIAVACSGCNVTSNYAANQVLGDSATPVSPRKGQRLEAGAVYQFTENGSAIRHCKEDFMVNRALKGVKVEVIETSGETRTDQLGLESLTVSIPGIPNIRVPYDKSRIDGYKVTVATVDGGRYQDFVYQGVGKNCRALLDKGAVVVAREARAEKTTRLMRGPVQGNIGIGIFSVGGADAELAVPGPKNVTFAIVPAAKE